MIKLVMIRRVLVQSDLPHLCLAVNGSFSYFIPIPNNLYIHGTVVKHNCLEGFTIGKTNDAGIGEENLCVNGAWERPATTCYAKCRSVLFILFHS